MVLIVFTSIWWSPTTTDLRKDSHHGQFCELYPQKFCIHRNSVPAEISSSEISSIVTYLSVKMSALTEFAILGRLVLEGLLGLFSFLIRLCPFLNNLAHMKTFLTKTYFSVHITHSSVNFTWFALISPQKFADRHLFKLRKLLTMFWIASREISNFFLLK